MSELKFDEAKHEYSINNQRLTSVTTILKKYGLSADYKNIPAKILKAAAQKGKVVHSELESFIRMHNLTGPNISKATRAMALLKKYVGAKGIDLSKAKAEEKYFNKKYKVAGTVDFQYQEDNKNIIADFKTTSLLHYDAIAWQLSIYNYLICDGDIMSYYFNDLKVFHFHNGKLNVKDIQTIEFDQIEALLEANLQGAPTFKYVSKNNIIPNGDEKLLKQLTNEIEQHKEHLKTLQAEQEKIIKKVKKNFLNSKRYVYVNKDLILKYHSPHTRTSVDKKVLKEYCKNNGLDFNKFCKTTTVKDRVSVKLYRDKDIPF